MRSAAAAPPSGAASQRSTGRCQPSGVHRAARSADTTAGAPRAPATRPTSRMLHTRGEVAACGGGANQLFRTPTTLTRLLQRASREERSSRAPGCWAGPARAAQRPTAQGAQHAALQRSRHSARGVSSCWAREYAPHSAASAVRSGQAALQARRVPLRQPSAARRGAQQRALAARRYRCSRRRRRHASCRARQQHGQQQRACAAQGCSSDAAGARQGCVTSHHRRPPVVLWSRQGAHFRAARSCLAPAAWRQLRHACARRAECGAERASRRRRKPVCRTRPAQGPTAERIVCVGSSRRRRRRA
jgi:hypothetical protein